VETDGPVVVNAADFDVTSDLIASTSLPSIEMMLKLPATSRISSDAGDEISCDFDSFASGAGGYRICKTR
jgi:hypothetical protein